MEIDGNGLGRPPRLHHAALPERFITVDHKEFDARVLAGHLSIHSDAGAELRGTVDADVKRADGVRAEAVLELRSSDAQRVPFHGGVVVRLAPILAGIADVTLIQP